MPEVPDHGEFTMSSPEEAVMLVQLAERADRNTDQPGHAWGRLMAKRVRDGKSEQGYKTFHLDQTAHVLTIVETWDDVETARKTIDLSKAKMPTPSGPTPPPDPGPAEPAFFRYPFQSADLEPEDELRDWLMSRADQDVTNLSVLPRRIRLFGDGFHEIVGLPHALAPHVGPGTGATLRAVRTRRGVERCFVEGWLGSVDGRGTAWILESSAEGWWLAMRTFERQPGMIGRWTSDWSQQVGRAAGTLSKSLRPILEPPADEPAVDVGEAQVPARAEIQMAGGRLGPNEPVPATAADVANRVGADFERALAANRYAGNVNVVVFRGPEWEKWDLDGEFPMGIDDMVRAISARGEPPTSLAVVKLDVITMQDVAYRAVVTEGEAAAHRYTRGLLIGIAPDGTVTGHQLVARNTGAIEDGWIGVAPVTDVSLFFLDAADA